MSGIKVFEQHDLCLCTHPNYSTGVYAHSTRSHALIRCTDVSYTGVVSYGHDVIVQ